MKEIELGKHKVTLYDAIDEMPMKRFHWFNKMMLVDSGVGSDLSDFDKHLIKARAFIAEKKNEQAMIELDNLRQNYFLIIQSVSPKMMSFSALIKSIDGQEYEDLSENGLQAVVEKLGDVPIKALHQALDEVKKKIDEDLRLFFPSIFEDAETKQYYDILKKRTILALDEIIHGEDDETRKQIEKLTTELITFQPAKTFQGSESLEITYEKNYSKICHLISHYINNDPKEFSVTEFYTAFEYVQEYMKAKAKSFKTKK